MADNDRYNDPRRYGYSRPYGPPSYRVERPDWNYAYKPRRKKMRVAVKKKKVLKNPPLPKDTKLYVAMTCTYEGYACKSKAVAVKCIEDCDYEGDAYSLCSDAVRLLGLYGLKEGVYELTYTGKVLAKTACKCCGGAEYK